MSDTPALPRGHFLLETILVAEAPTLSIVQGGRAIPLVAAARSLGLTVHAQSLFELLAHWESESALVHQIAEASALHPEWAVARSASVPQFGAARKVMCAGANYYKHLAEMDVKYEKDASKPPFFFMKPHNALVGPGRTVPVDPSIKMLDWEVEMAAVIGRSGRDISVEHALEHVAGYTVAVDVTARDRLFQPESIFKFDFLAGKGQDGFCPTANSFLPAAFMTDPQKVRLGLAVNGVVKQDASTDDMIYSVAELVSWASRLTTLEPGDLLLTGSPEGVGFPRKEFLKVGDVMKVSLERLGTFEVEVFAKPSFGERR